MVQIWVVLGFKILGVHFKISNLGVVGREDFMVDGIILARA